MTSPLVFSLDIVSAQPVFEEVPRAAPEWVGWQLGFAPLTLSPEEFAAVVRAKSSRVTVQVVVEPEA